MRISPFAFVLLLALNLKSADWPAWRGRDGTGVSLEKNLPSEWSKDKNIKWEVDLPGKGASSAITHGSRVYLTAQGEDTAQYLIALNQKDGQVIWQKQITQGKLKSHNLHNMATPTPVTDGKNVWVMFGNGELACVDLNGNIVWNRNLVKEFGEYKTNHGYGSSPVLDDGKIYVACMHQGPSYLIAVDAKTGKTVWKKDRNLGPTDEAQDSYSSPFVLKSKGSSAILLQGAEAVTASDPKSGETKWTFGQMKVPHPYGRTISGVTATEGTVLAVASGFQNRGYTVAIKPDGKGDVTSSHKLWSQAKYSPDCPTPLIYQGYVYLIRDDGMASCLDLKSGEPAWQERLFSENVKVSPVAGDGKVYFTSGQANTAVVKAGPKFERLSRNQLNDVTVASPALSNGHIFLRTEQKLYCIGQ
jgi:outer membrane protein assembly factor BamB